MSILDSQTAMILAAGLGTRLSPLTKHTPKPLVKISGLPILDHIINLSLSSGIKTFVVNIHHLSEQIKSHLEQHKDINIIFWIIYLLPGYVEASFLYNPTFVLKLSVALLLDYTDLWNT